MSLTVVSIMSAHKPKPEEEALKEAARQAQQRVQDALHRLQRKLEDDVPPPPAEFPFRWHRREQ
jgi:hypothetical protein